MKNKFIFLVTLLLVGCSLEEKMNPDIEKIKDHQTFQCNYDDNDNISWELRHGVTVDSLIDFLEACKKPKFKRGDVLFYKNNKNCKFQVYYNTVLYPDRSNGSKPQALYGGKEDCNGLISDLEFYKEDELKRK